MSLIGIWLVLVYFGSLENGVVSTDWVDDLTKYIVEDSEFYQVKLMTRMAADESLGNPLIEELSIKLMQNLATVRINYDHDFKLSADFGNDSSATLLILAIESPAGRFSIPMATKFIDAIVETTRYHEGSKYLVVSFARDAHRSLEELLQHAWKKKLLEFTVIELLEKRGSRSSIEMKRPPPPPPPPPPPSGRPIIHRLDPFQGLYSRTNSPRLSKKNLFPDKLDNMKGYNLRIMGSRYWEPKFFTPFSWVQRTRILVPLLGKLNCSKNYVPMDPGNVTTMLSDIARHDIDFSNSMFPYFPQELNDEQRSVVVKIDRLCPLVPVRFKDKSVPFTELIKACALSLAVVMIFWIFMRFFRLNSYTWRMFNIARTFFGISVSQQPWIALERIIFACLLLISATYSSLVYATITDMTFSKTVEMEYNTFEELDNSGLTPYITESNFVRASHITDPQLEALVSKSVKEPNIFPCIISADEKPVICFSDGSFADDYVKEGKTKWAKMCLWDQHYTFIFGKGSPYRSRINKLIMRLQSSGMAEEIAPSQKNEKKKYELAEVIKTTSIFPQLRVICILGYSLSIIIFIGEIIYHRVSLYWKSRSRRANLPHPLPYCE